MYAVIRVVIFTVQEKPACRVKGCSVCHAVQRDGAGRNQATGEDC
jgi:hypothetical protein